MIIKLTMAYARCSESERIDIPMIKKKSYVEVALSSKSIIIITVEMFFFSHRIVNYQEFCF